MAAQKRSVTWALSGLETMTKFLNRLGYQHIINLNRGVSLGLAGPEPLGYDLLLILFLIKVLDR